MLRADHWQPAKTTLLLRAKHWQAAKITLLLRAKHWHRTDAQFGRLNSLANRTDAQLGRLNSKYAQLGRITSPIWASQQKKQIMEIISLNLYKLRNMAHYEFHSEVKKLIEANTAATLNVETQFAEYVNLLQQERQGLETIRQSDLTAILAQIDEERDHLFSGIVENAHSLCKHFDTAVQQAAQQLLVIFHSYGNIAQKSYNEETAAIDRLAQELLDNKSEALNTCGLTQWVETLKSKNETFRKHMQERNQILAAQEPVHMRSLRKAIDQCYRAMTKRIEASALLNGNANYKSFLQQLNTRIEYYKEHNIK